MKRKFGLGIIFTLIFIVLVSFAACGGVTNEAQQQTVEVDRGDIIRSITADGNISLPQDRKLTFDINGTVVEVNVAAGDRVTEGQVLAKVDTTSLDFVVETAGQLVKTGEAAVRAAGQTVKTGELAVKAAEIDLEAATDNFRRITYPYDYTTFAFSVPESLGYIRDAQEQLKRVQEQFEPGLTQEQYLELKEQLRLASENLEEASERLNRGEGWDVFGEGILPTADFWTLRAAQLQMEKAQLAVETANINQEMAKVGLERAQIDLNNANIGLDKANVDLEKAVIFAPFDGVVAAVNIKEGDTLSAVDYASRVAVQIIDPRHMELEAEVDEIDIPAVELGQRVIIDLDALPDNQLEGKVSEISPVSIMESGIVLYNIIISFDVPEGYGLKSGMSATADIITGERIGVLLVPNRAIQEDTGGNPIVEVMVNGQTVQKPVVTGISDGLNTEIVSGLSEGEIVVIEVRGT